MNIEFRSSRTRVTRTTCALGIVIRVHPRLHFHFLTGLIGFTGFLSTFTTKLTKGHEEKYTSTLYKTSWPFASSWFIFR